MSRTLPLIPRMSEKSYALSQDDMNVYVFNVPKAANKLTVAKAVESQFKVTVEGVNILVNKGKSKRFIKNGRPAYGQRSDQKKAYVTLKKDDKLPIFDALEEEEKKEEKLGEAVAKQAEKQQQKEVKKESKKKRSFPTFGRAPRQTQNRGGEK